MVNGLIGVETDFSNNLRGYLNAFDSVTFACPLFPDEVKITTVSMGEIEDSDRLFYLQLPYAYREDRYIRNYGRTRRALRSAIAAADYLAFSPHAKFDWSTLAVKIAVKMGRRYDIESDWVQEDVQRHQLSYMRPGINKLRKRLWIHSYSREFRNCLKHSSVALLQGGEVFSAYKDIAPNPHKVLNVQLARKDQISSADLESKLKKIKDGLPLTICYAGRMVEMKGPVDWLYAVHGALSIGVKLTATWFGDGTMMSLMRREVERLELNDQVSLPGALGRDEVLNDLRRADIFLFCHKTGESPRCLVEALASGCLILGYDSAYPRDLVATHGGGLFVAKDDWHGLAQSLLSLGRDRERLASLVVAAAASGRLFDRDTAIQRRINLIKKYLAQPGF
jgi:glycosyltransferase involved in cell wall biosynthesis